MRAVFIGPPGAGKGTQAARIASSRSLPHVATGDLFRSALSEGTELGKRAKEFMTSGRLVSDDIVIGMVDDRLGRGDARESFLLDGYPRTMAQAAALDRLLAARNQSLDAVVNFEIEDEELVERASGRMVCRGCGASYNVRSAPPKQAGVCDRCGQPLYRRDDDRPDVVRERLKVYREQTRPLIDHYRERSLLRSVRADRSIEAISRELEKLLPR